MDSPDRYWFNLWGCSRHSNGWAFGGSPEAACDDALAQVRRWTPGACGDGRLTLQRDVTPVQYFEFRVRLPAGERLSEARGPAGEAPVRRLTCGCCNRGCVCWNHQDTPRGLPPRRCHLHAETSEAAGGAA